MSGILLTALIAFGSAIVGAILGALFQKLWTPDLRPQVKDLQDQLTSLRKHITDIEQGRTAEQAEGDQWAERLERFSNRLRRISPSLMIQPRGQTSHEVLYSAIFPDPKFQAAIEAYLVQTDSGRTRFLPRTPRPDELRRLNFRATLEAAERQLEDFRKRRPGVVEYYLGDGKPA